MVVGVLYLIISNTSIHVGGNTPFTTHCFMQLVDTLSSCLSVPAASFCIWISLRCSLHHANHDAPRNHKNKYRFFRMVFVCFDKQDMFVWCRIHLLIRPGYLLPPPYRRGNLVAVLHSNSTFFVDWFCSIVFSFSYVY